MKYHYLHNKIEKERRFKILALTWFNWGSLLLVLGVWPIGWILSFIFLIFVHEFGHYIIAKMDGIYLGWGLLPTPMIRTTGNLKSNGPFIYLTGILFSLLLYPLFMLQGMPFLLFYIICLLLGVADIICVGLWYIKPWSIK